MTDQRPGKIDPLRVLQSFSAMRRNLSMYPDGHAIIEQTVEELEATVEQALEEHGRIRIEVIGATAHVDGWPLRLESQANVPFLEEFEGLGMQCLQIDAGVSRDELVSVARLLNDLGSEGSAHTSMRQRLAEAGVHHVTISKLLPVRMQRQKAVVAMPAPEGQDAEYAQALASAQVALAPMFEGGALDPRSVAAVLERIGERILDRRSALADVLAVKEYENHSYCHSVNVASLSVLLGRRLGLNTELLEVLAEAALLHDIGKRTMPPEIVSKPGPLNLREWKFMQRHPALGAEILISTPGISPISATVALEHHRHFDGSGGYPDLGDRTPHLISQIVAVADTYEALTGARAYRAPLVPDEACLIMAGMAGVRLNPDLVRTFVSLVTFFPLGSVVRTSRGEVGVVVETREHEPLHPTIFTIDREGVSANAGQRIDTAKRGEDGEYHRHIVESLPEAPPRLPDEAWGNRERSERSAAPRDRAMRPRREGRTTERS